MNNNSWVNGPQGALNAIRNSNYGTHVTTDLSDKGRLSDHAASRRARINRIRAIKSKHNLARYHRIDGGAAITNAEALFVFTRLTSVSLLALERLL